MEDLPYLSQLLSTQPHEHYTPKKLIVLALAPPPPEPPAILSSFLLVSIPRCRGASPLRLLPREVLQRIAHFAFQPRYRAAFRVAAPEDVTLSLRLPWPAWSAEWSQRQGAPISSLEASKLDMTECSDVVATLVRPLKRGLSYIEVTYSLVWYGSHVAITFGRESLGMRLQTQDGDDAPKEVVLVYTRERRGAEGAAQAVVAWDRAWTWCQDPAVFGFLVDLDRGRVTLRFNGIDGPSVGLLGSAWKDGVRVLAGGFPNPPPHQHRGRAHVSCATPPTPPSLAAAAATQPNLSSSWAFDVLTQS